MWFPDKDTFSAGLPPKGSVDHPPRPEGILAAPGLKLPLLLLLLLLLLLPLPLPLPLPLRKPVGGLCVRSQPSLGGQPGKPASQHPVPWGGGPCFWKISNTFRSRCYHCRKDHPRLASPLGLLARSPRSDSILSTFKGLDLSILRLTNRLLVTSLHAG